MPAIDYSAHLGSTLPPPTPATAPAGAGTHGSSSGFSFDDFLDIINPLQHIPVISTIYRHLTGDKIGIPEKIMGDSLYGGVLGFVTSVGDTVFQEITGKDVGDTVYAFLTGSDDKAPSGIASSADTTIASGSNTPDMTSLMTAVDNQGIDPGTSVATSGGNTIDMASLMSAVDRQGIDSGTAQRALFAYSRTAALN